MEQGTGNGRGLAAGVAALAVVKVLLHLATTGRHGYGFFVDELYFLACADHLAWGYVDLPPLFPALTALVKATLGESLPAIRLVPALAGGALVWLAGRLALEMGGRTRAQLLAALAVLAAPGYLATHSIHTMNALEPLFWMGGALLMARIANGGSPRLWLLFGLVAGLGALNKHSMAFFGLAATGALLLTGQRAAFRSRWIWLGAGLAVLVVLPNAVWVVANGFPHLELLRNIEADGRDVSVGPPGFLAEQVLFMNPLAAPLWVGGLLWLLRGPRAERFRVLGLTYLGILGLLLALNGRTYYLMPAYAMLLAAGAVAFEAWTERTGRRVLLPAAAVALVAGGAVLAPLAAPLLAPETYVRYTRAIGVEQPRVETHRLGPLPQLFADRFGWPEMAQEVARIYHALPEEERRKAGIFGQNYGQAGAIDRFGPTLGLPRAISGHLTYFHWGPRDLTGEVLIVLDDSREQLLRLFHDVTLAGRVHHPYSMPYQHFDVYVCRRPKQDLRALWPMVKRYR